MANDGIITRKDIIQDEALKWGEEYTKNVEVAIKANKEFVSEIKELAKAYRDIAAATNNSELLRAKEAERLANMKALNAVKQLEAADKAHERVKQEQIKTANALALAEQKLAQEKQKTIASTVRTEEVERKAEIARRRAIESSALLGSEYRKLNKERTEAKRKVMDLMASEEKNTKAIKEAQKEFDKLDKKVRAIDKSVGDFSKNVGNYPFKSIATNVRDLVGAFGIVGGVAIFANALKGAWNTVKEFDTAITELSAVTEIPKKQLGSLKGVIVEVSKTSVNSAVDVAKLAVELSKLGASTTQIEAMIETVDRFSVAMEASGEESASFLLGVMNSFGASAEEAERYGDVMAQAANISALGFEELKNSLKTFAPVANAANLTIERASALTGVLVDNNVEATTAGTSLRSIFLQLAKSGLTYEQAMSQINGSTNKLATATNLFGKESATAALILAGNTEKIAEYETKLNDASGALQALNETKMDSLEKQIGALKSAWEGLILSIEDGDGILSDFVKNFTKGLSIIINKISDLNKSTIQLVDDKYKETYKNQTKVLDDLIKREVMLGVVRKAQSEGNFDWSKEQEEKKRLYAENRQEIDALIESEKGLFKSSKDFEQRNSKSKKDIEDISLRIAEQTALVQKLKNEREEGSLIGNMFLKRYEALDEANEKLEKLMILEGKFKAERDALNDFGKTSEKVNALTTGGGDEDDEKSKKAREKAEKERLAKLKKAFEDEYKLRMWRLNRTKELNQEIVDNEDSTTDERIESYLRIQELEQAIASETAEYKLRQITEFTEGARKLSKDEINTLVDGGEIKTKLTNEEKLVLEELQAKRDEINKRQEKNLQKLIDLEAKRLTDGVEKELGGFKNNENKELTAENDSYKLLLDQYGYTEQAEQAHQERLLAIKNKYLKQGLEAQIKVFDQLAKDESLSNELKENAASKSLEFKKQLSELELDVVKNKAEKEKEEELKKEEFIRDLQQKAKAATIELVNTIFEAKIQKIDDEIAKNEEYYARQIELAGDDQKQKELLEAEAEKKRQELEAKKRKEQTKQAIFNKGVKLLEIGWATALGIMNAVSLFPLTGGLPWSAIVAGIGAAQAASVISAPIPKYKTGRKGGKEEFAILGDGGVSEVLERKGGGLEITPAYDTLYHLQQGDIVHKSVDDFFKSKLNSMNKGLSDSQNKMNSYQEMVMLNIPNNTELLEEMKKNTAAIKNSKPIVIQSKAVDINFELWKNSQTNWNR